MAIGIAAYNCYFPSYRLSAGALRQAWNQVPQGFVTKPVADLDEDALTLATAAAQPIAPPRVDALALASTTLPYRRKVQAGLLAVGLGLGSSLFVSEHTTSARAGTEAFLTQLAILQARGAGTGLVAAADLPSGPARGGADANMGAGAVALVLAEGGEAAGVEGYHGYVDEDPGLQFVRAEETVVRDVQVPDYAGTAYSAAVAGAALPLLEHLGRRGTDYRFVVLNPPEPRLARNAARVLGIGDPIWQAAWPYSQTGDLGAAHPLVGLAVALDAAEPGDRILVVAYGSGSSADAISLVAGTACGQGKFARALQGGQEVDYLTYLKLRGEV